MTGATFPHFSSNAAYSRTHLYDSLSRPTKVTLSINGKNYVYNRSYNSDGRVATLTYPSGLVVQYVYTPLGYLSQLKDNATGAVLWTANARDAEMHLTDQLAGNGVDTIQVFDPNTGLVQQIRASADGHDDGSTASFSYQFDKIGNLLNRADNFGSTEQFCYDTLNRLTNYSVGGASCRAGFGLLKSVAYDDIGNITNKSDLADGSGGTGAYTYPNPTNPLPHAVKSISGTANGVTNPGFRYDANGNLTCEYTGPNCSHGAITKETDAYWSFNMAHTITEGATSLTLTYDSEHARVTQALTTASTTTTTNYLNDPVSGAMAEKVTTGSTNTWNDYLMVDGRLIGERTCSAAAPTCSTGATWQYFVLDHLGSVAVVTDGTGTVLAGNGRLSFDAWGKQRNENGSDDLTCSNGLTSPTTRGFTSQEEIATFCLVNLNARIYDPTIGRFMAADSMIPDPYDGQSYNRYSYTDNRPLSFTDTTGHDVDGPQAGDCGIVCMGNGSHWNPGSQSGGHLDPYANPNTSCSGNCGGTVHVSGFVSGGHVTITAITVTANMNGERAQSNGGCGTGAGCDSSTGAAAGAQRNETSKFSGSSDDADHETLLYAALTHSASADGGLASSLAGSCATGGSCPTGAACPGCFQVAEGPDTREDDNARPGETADQIARTLGEPAEAARDAERQTESDAVQARARGQDTARTEQEDAEQFQFRFGSYKSAETWRNQIQSRGWTEEEISRTIQSGARMPAPNNINPSNGAIRIISPNTGQSLVMDELTGEIIHLGGPGFRY